MEFTKGNILNTPEELDALPKDTIIIDFFNDGEFEGQLCTVAQKMGNSAWATTGVPELFTAEQLLAGGDTNYVILRHGTDSIKFSD